ncbi:hypothetical protein TNCV_1193061 [Trichonephila clavipes]|nr:hypothetical protein TNCV_1193061 [Trichonephila clavipes]
MRREWWSFDLFYEEFLCGLLPIYDPSSHHGLPFSPILLGIGTFGAGARDHLILVLVSKIVPFRRSTEATPPGSHRSTNRHHAT